MECRNCPDLKNCQRQCMKLPDGKTCADCWNVGWCTMAYGVKPENTSCRFEPVRFKQKLEAAVNRETPKTNGDWIRAMSDEGLAAFIGQNSLCDRVQGEGSWCDDHATCDVCLVGWLKQPAEEKT